MSQNQAEFNTLPTPPFSLDERLIIADLAPHDAAEHAADFLSLRHATWMRTLVPRNVVSAAEVTQEYAPTSDNIASQVRKIRDSGARTHYIAATKLGGEFPALVGLARITSLPDPIWTGQGRADVYAGALDIRSGTDSAPSQFDTSFQGVGLGSLLLARALSFYGSESLAQAEEKPNIHDRERKFIVQVSAVDRYAVDWLGRLGVMPATLRGNPSMPTDMRKRQQQGHILCVGDILPTRQRLHERLSQSGFYNLVTPEKPSGSTEK